MRTTILLTTALFVFGCDDGNNSNNTSVDMAVAGDVDMAPDLGAVTGCDLVKQDCPSGDKCTTAGGGGGGGGGGMMMATTQCVANGTVADGMPCTRTNGADNCLAGLSCARASGSVCRKICADDTGCATGQKCATLSRAITTAGLCTPSCTPFGNDCTGANNCSSMTTTLAMEPFFTCRAPGTTTEFNDCNFGNSCVADEVCDTTQMWCAPLCDSTHSCPANSGDAGIPLSCKSFNTGLASDPGYCGG
jgi:hypothetical protein